MRKPTLLMLSLLVVMSLIIAACGPTPAPEIVEKEVPVEVTRVVVETQVVQGEEVEVTRIVQEEVQVVVTATPEPVEREEAPAVLGVLPRSETLIAAILTGRVGSPGNFNEWVGWKSRDRGMQNLANEPL
jgi:hypothetical protein